MSAPAGQRCEILDVPVDAVTLAQAVERCEDAIQRRSPLVVACVNAAKLVTMRCDDALNRAVRSCDLILADGMAVVWAGRLLGRPLPERVGGIDLFLALLAEGDRRAHSVYLLGARQPVLEEVAAKIQCRYPRLRIVGLRNGYFGDDDVPELVAEIRRSGADMLFVGISSPKKELFLARFGREIDVPLAHGVGGAFDVLAGRVRRAPRWMQFLGLEWLFRVLQEPRRLWRRYLVTNTVFTWMVLGQLLGRSRRT